MPKYCVYTLPESAFKGVSEQFTMRNIPFVFISGNKSENNLGVEQTWAVKTDSLGNKQWDKRFGGTSGDLLFSFPETGPTQVEHLLIIAGMWYLTGTSHFLT